MSDKALLKINLNDEYKIKIEEGEQFEDSIFSEVYMEALKNVIEIVRHYDSHKDSKYDDFNNIVAFTGERGKGKSSSMISFRDALVNKECDNNRIFFGKKNDSEQNLKDKSFAEIDIIDPSLFRGGESLFEIILAKMFRKFQDGINDKDCKIDQTHKRELIQHFQKTFQNLQIINSDRKDIFKKDSIEALSKLAISTNLKEDFDKLVDYYLENFDKKNFLIIAIDDFDVNIENSYKMLEDIRQFLIQPKVMLLISCKIEQLNEAISIQFEKLGINKNHIENKTSRYLAKLIPFNRRIYLPDVQKLKDISVELYDEKKLLLFTSEKLDFNKSLMKLIFEKKSILLLENLLESNFVLPETIRETQAFINTFSSENNLVNIKNYLIEEIYKKNIEKEVFTELENTPYQWFNLIVFKKLYTLFESYLIPEDPLKINLPKRISESKLPNVISYGDVYYLLLEIEKKYEIDDYECIKFLDYFKVYFTIKTLLFSENTPTNLPITKYGFVNSFTDLLSKEGEKSRSLIEFSADRLEDLKNNDDKFFLSQFLLYLGVGYRGYRFYDHDDIFVNRYGKGTFSPFAIFHNLFNIDILSEIFEYSKDSAFIQQNINWFNQSKFIKNLYNPSFTLSLFKDFKDFRNREIKSSLPPTYLDDLCLLFIYGIIYSLSKIENKYSVNGLVYDFIKYPIVKVLLKYFEKVNYKSSVTKELNEKYNILALIQTDYEMSQDLINVINNIFTNPETSNNKTSDVVKSVLKRISNKINRTNFTSAVYYKELNELYKLNDTEQITKTINSFKGKINSKNQSIKSTAQVELKNYLKSLE